ncbi:MAG TPA: hypothetical protein VHC00_00450 [Rhizobiaceae bacterium]|nr:hypothetical protein [Rhizobiaceae bacterium]
MAKKFLSQINWDVPIVDSAGRPLLSFIQQWNALARITGSIPDASDAAAMSLLLDHIASTEGDLLRRGSAAWAGLPTPGDVDKFLRADGTYAPPPRQTVDESEINLSDVLTNNVSTARHGFAPKLPNDATKYLDGTGAYSVPAGGGGGSAGYWAINDNSSSTSSTTSAKLNVFTPVQDFTLDKVSLFSQWLTTQTLGLRVFETDFSTLGTLIAEAAAVTPVEAGLAPLFWTFDTPAALSALIQYCVVVYETSGASFEAFLGSGRWQTFPAVVSGNGGTIATSDPQTGDSITVTGVKPAFSFHVN